MKFNVSEVMDKADKDYGLGSGEYFKIQEGANKFRLLSPGMPHQSEYMGKLNLKFVAWILDRKDSKIKLYFMPRSILKAIKALQDDPEYKFDEVPMPYDLTINATNAGTMDVDYQVTAARSNTALTEDEIKAFADKPTINEVLEKLIEKQSQSKQPEATSDDKKRSDMAEAIATPPPADEIKVEDIPF